MKYDRIYFDEKDKVFKPCYESCKRCDKEGNLNEHNCLSCDSGYIPEPETKSTLFNCVTNCSYSFYFSEFGQYKCTDIPYCPIEVNKYIKEKNKCIDDCKKDATYKYLYNGMCHEKCPDNTFEENFLCKEINYKKCTISEKDVRLKNFFGEGGLNAIIKSYIDEFFYTNKHLSIFINENFKILVYKEQNCLNELVKENNESSLNLRNLLTFSDFPKFEFGECYDKVKKYYNIKDDLIITIVDNFGLSNPSSSYSFYNPYTGEKLDAQTICKDDNIIIKENILTILNFNNINYESLLKLADQDINIFNKSDAFYTDICFHFESPNNKDITLKDRLLLFFPNITLCDSMCENTGVNLTTMTAICKCQFNDIVNLELIQDNAIIGKNLNEAIEFITNSNLEVLKCYKYIFKYFKNSIGGYIIIISIAIIIPLSLYFYFKDLNLITKYIIEKTNEYLNYLNNLNIKDKKEQINLNKSDIIVIKNKDNFNIFKNKNKENNKTGLKMKSDSNQNSLDHGKDILSINKNSNNSKEIFFSKEYIYKNKITGKNISKIEDFKIKEDFKEYLEPELDDLDFDDAIKKDNRGFFEYLCDSIVEKQLIMNTFCLHDPLRPLSIKIILFLLIVILYLVINGIFFSEDYISQIYHLEEEDNFFSFFHRSINRFIYSAIVSVIISFIIDCYFVKEKKLKGIFNREKDSIPNMKIEISYLNKNIKKRYLSFIIMVFILSIFFLFYLLCFNYVYPNTQIEWIKSSITLIIIMQIGAIFASLAETVLRYLSFILKSERIFRLSKVLD